MGCSSTEAADLRSPLAKYVEARVSEFGEIPSNRREPLLEIAAYVRSQRDAKAPMRLTFICTANSRRSQMAQIWAAVAATRYEVEEMDSFSGGTESTAFNPRAIAALQRAGIAIKPVATAVASTNPRYYVSFARGQEPLECFSKVYNERPNPKAEFCAVMVCSQADDACPRVSGATQRVSLPYEDPKAADGTPEEPAAYDERCAQIARELLYVFSRAAEHE